MQRFGPVTEALTPFRQGGQKVCACDGFRMPAHDEPLDADRGPASESRQGRKAREVGHPIQHATMEIWPADAAQRAGSMRPGRRQASGNGQVAAPMGAVTVVGAGRLGLMERWRWALRPCEIVAGHEPAA